MRKIDMACLIANGFISDVDIQNYPDPLDINYDISFNGACEYYHDTVQLNVNQIQNKYNRVGFTTSAGMDSSTVLCFANPKLNPATVCLDNKRTDPILSKRLVSDLRLNDHHTISIDNISLEKELIELNTMLYEPATQLFLLVFHIVLKYMAKQNIDALFTGSGIDFPLMESNYQNLRCIATGIKLHQYDINRANDIILNSKYPHLDTLMSKTDLWKIALLDPSSKKYPNNYFYDMFNEQELNMLGLEYPYYYLRKEELSHRVSLETYTYFSRLVEPVSYIMKYFNFDLVNPFRVDNIWEWVKTLPFEYRNCLGSGKHLQREAIGPRLPDYIMNKERTMFDPSNVWFDSKYIKGQIDLMIQKYLISKNNVIFNYIKYDDMQKSLNMFNHSRNRKDQIWTMLNLSIWLNIHERG